VFPIEGSPTWKAVEHGPELVKKVIVWRTCSGRKVQIWWDPWINRDRQRKITMKKGRSRLRWVSRLMLPNQKEWNEQLIRECMYPHNELEVMQIRLSGWHQDDQLAWL
jgi:hypothetical protein